MIVPRRAIARLALAATVTAIIAAAVFVMLPVPLWVKVLAVAAGPVAGPVGRTFLQRIGDQFDSLRRQDDALLAHTRLHDAKGRLAMAGDRALEGNLGIAPAALAATVTDASHGTALPPYVCRDADDAAELKDSFRRGGLVIIEGESAAGKTRTAYEAMRRLAPERRVIVPRDLTSLRAIADAGVQFRDAVIWLDDINDYLSAGGLDAGILDRLCPPGRTDVLVLATLRAEARKELSVPGLEVSVARAVRETLGRASLIPLSRELSASERQRAEDLREADPRIATALDQETGAGFAEYLAAAPEIRDRWRSARDGENIVAGAIISAAVDARRLGYVSPMPRALLRALHGLYLESRQAHLPGLPGFGQALDWARQPVRGASGCLISISGSTYRPFDYLVETAQVSGMEAPPEVWPVLLAHATQSDLLAIGLSAYRAGRTDISESAWRKSADNGNTDAMFNMGILLAESGQLDESERRYRQAAAAGHTDAMNNLGLLLDESSPDEAELWWRKAARAGLANAMSNLAVRLDESGRSGEAEDWWRKAAARGHADAMYNLSALLHQSGRDGEATKWCQQAADAGQALAMTNLGSTAYRAGDEVEAERRWRQAAATGLPTAMFRLGGLFQRAGQSQEAERWWQQAAAAGDARAMYQLGAIAMRSGQEEGAESWWRQAADAGDARAMNNLGLNEQQSGHAENAESWWRQAAAAGDTDAMVNIGGMLHDSGRDEEAQSWWEQAASAGDVSAMFNLGLLSSELGRTEDAERWWRQAASEGHAEAMVNIGGILHDSGRDEEAGRWWQRAAATGNATAMYNVGKLHDLLGRAEEAQQSYLQAAEAGHSEAMFHLGILLHQSGRPEEAGSWWKQAATTGHARAMFNLGSLHQDAGRPQEAERWWQQAAATGDPDVAYMMGALCSLNGRHAEAKHWLRRAAAAGQPEAIRDLSHLDIDTARSVLQQLIDSGHPDYAPRAAVSLGVLLQRHGDMEGAKTAFRKALDSGHPDQADIAQIILDLPLFNLPGKGKARMQIVRAETMRRSSLYTTAAEPRNPSTSENA